MSDSTKLRQGNNCMPLIEKSLSGWYEGVSVEHWAKQILENVWLKQNEASINWQITKHPIKRSGPHPSTVTAIPIRRERNVFQLVSCKFHILISYADDAIIYGGIRNGNCMELTQPSTIREHNMIKNGNVRSTGGRKLIFSKFKQNSGSWSSAL